MAQAKKFDYSKLVMAIAAVTFSFYIAFGAYLCFSEVKPFWLDEWFIIYNLKFRPAKELWDQLLFMQQFPRLYLQIFKSFSSFFDYSYTSLRFLSFAVHSTAILFAIRLSGKIFKENTLHRFLWVMIYAAFTTSLHYFVQAKQYTMEMFLALVGIWQLLQLLTIVTEGKIKAFRYLLLCSSFAIAPFFSYTYPIVVCPIFIIILLAGFSGKNSRAANIFYLWFPLLICAAGNIIFYMVDVRQVMQDQGMQTYWDEFLVKDHFKPALFFRNVYMLFSNVGAGLLFETLFGILGISSFLYSSYQVALKGRWEERTMQSMLLTYSVILLWTVIALYLAGKLPVGTHRLNAFALPATAFMIIFMLQEWMAFTKAKPVSITIAILLFIGTTGNVYSSLIGSVTSADHATKLKIYNNVKNGIEAAHAALLPILVTSNVAYPDADKLDGDWVLQTHPAYKVSEMIHAYKMKATDNTDSLLSQLHLASAVYIDADSWKKVQLH